MMKKEDARQAVLAEWYRLPEEQRCTEDQAVEFASRMMSLYRFRGAGDPYQTIKAWLRPTLELAALRVYGPSKRPKT